MPDKVGDRYHDFDHRYAKILLQKAKFPQKKIHLVLNAIKQHGSGSKYRRRLEPLEITLLRDADKLDSFGQIGVARIIMVRTQRGDTLQAIVDDFFIHGHLKRKWDSLRLPESKKISKKDYAYARQFLQKLAKTVRVPSK